MLLELLGCRIIAGQWGSGPCTTTGNYKVDNWISWGCGVDLDGYGNNAPWLWHGYSV